MPSGGKREGAGAKLGNQNARKVMSVDERTVKLLDSILKRKARDTGKTWLDQVVEMAYDSGAMATARIGALKMIADIKGVIVKQSHKTIDEHKTIHGAPVVLPVMNEDPSKLNMDAPPSERRH